jgi:hypothetical protein
MKITANTSDVPSEVIRKLCVLLAPSGVTGYRVRVMFAPNSWGAHGHAKVERNATTIKMPGVARRYLTSGREGQGYIAGTAIGSRAESIIFLIAHELRHLWQARVKRGWRVWGSRGQYSERDADAYAIGRLRAFRRGEIAGLREVADQIPPGESFEAYRQRCAVKRARVEADMAKWSALHSLPAKLRKACPVGVTTDGEHLDAPRGYVWASTGCHWITLLDDVEDTLTDVRPGLELCAIDDCDSCEPVQYGPVKPEVIATPKPEPIAFEKSSGPVLLFKGPAPVAIDRKHPGYRKWLTRSK